MRAPRGRKDQLAAVLRIDADLVSVDSASAALNLDRRAAAKTLARWAQQGWLRRVRRGLYAAVPLAISSADRVIEDEWVLVPRIFGSAYVGGASAAHHWDLTEQLFRTVFVFTTQSVRRTDQTIHGVRFSVHHIRNDLLFGTRPLWRGRVKIQISDIHRTVIDILSDPDIGGGARHVADCLTAYLRRADADAERLIDYADRLGNGAVFKRLGFLTERIQGPSDLVEACVQRLTKGNAKLDPALPSPRLIRRWRLWVPSAWKDGKPR